MQIKLKRESIYKQIRRSQIQELKDRKRKEINFNYSHEYDLLKNINLTETIWKFKNKFDESQIVEQSLNNIFLYATSRQSDHLFFIFDEDVLSKLQTILQSSYSQRNQKALWIMTNYILYDKTLSHPYIESLKYYWKYPDTKIRQLVLNSLQNLTESTENTVQIVNQHKKFIQQIIQYYMNNSVNTSPPIFLSFLTIFSNITLSIPYQSIPNNLMFHQFPNIIKNSPSQDIKSTLCEIYRLLIIQNIDQNPYLILKLKEQIKESSQLISKQLSIKGFSIKFVISGLRFLKSVYKLNIPQDEKQQQFLEFFQDLFVTDIFNIFQSIKSITNQKIHTAFLQVLEETCLEYWLLHHIIFDHIQIVSYLFYCGKFLQFKSKKSAIICLCNCLTVCLDDCQTQQKIIEIYTSNDFIQIINDVLRSVQDPQLLEYALQSINNIFKQQNKLNMMKQYDQDLQRQYKLLLNAILNSQTYQYILGLGNHKQNKIKQLSFELANLIHAVRLEN